MRDWAVDAFTVIVGLNEVRKVEVFSCKFLCEGVFREVSREMCDCKSVSFRICTVSSGIVKTS